MTRSASGARVVEQAVAAAGRWPRNGPSLPARCRGRRRRTVGRLAGLEEHVGILRRAAQHRPVRRERASRCARTAPRRSSRAGRRPQLLDLGDLVRGPEAVEEVQERNARLERGGVGDQRRGRGPPEPTRSTAWRSRSGGRPSRRSGRRRSTARAWQQSRAATCMEKGVSSPAILYMLGIISSRPCEAVKVVVSAPAWSAPCTAPAAPASDCISTTCGTLPHRCSLPVARPLVAELAHRRGRGDRVDRDHLAHTIGDRCSRLVSIDRDHSPLPLKVTSAHPVALRRRAPPYRE